jgi:phospholipase/carboxylesterase
VARDHGPQRRYFFRHRPNARFGELELVDHADNQVRRAAAKIKFLNLMHNPLHVSYGGKPLAEAKRALLLVHGRGGVAEKMLALASEIQAADYAWIAPQATQNTWYPLGFMGDEKANGPWLAAALASLDAQVDHVLAAGIPVEQLWILGFSQGACLTLEFAARRAQRFGGLISLTGGLIGQTLHPENYMGDFAATPIYISAGDLDPHVPLERAEASAKLLREMNAEVDLQVFPGRPHTISEVEMRRVMEMLR